MIKKSIIFLAFFFLLLARPVKAYDLEVVCDATSCSPNNSPALFPSSEIWYPSKSLSKTVRIRNISAGNTLAVSTKAQNIIIDNSICQLDKQQLLLSIVRINSSPPNYLVWSGYLNDFYNASSVALANFSPNSYDDFIYTISMRYQAGNECQDKLTKFDLILNFTAADIVNPTPTPTTGAGGGGGEAGAGVSNPVCNDSPPASAPTLNSAVPGVNSVTLTWTPAGDPVSYYLIAYGTSPGIYTFGNPNVGGKDTTTYTIYGLSGGTYYFTVRAGNGCMPGPFSNELSSIPSGGAVSGIATNFVENVQGIATSPAQLEEKEEIKGIETKTVCSTCFWWQILLGEIIISIIYFWILIKKYKFKEPVKKSLIIPLITYLIFLWLNRNCLINLFFVNSSYFFCRYFWLIDIFIYLIIFTFWKKPSKNKESSRI